MSLYITHETGEAVKQVRPKKNRVVYKIYRSLQAKPEKSKVTVGGLYYGGTQKFEMGKEKTSSRRTLNILPEEKRDNTIRPGFHVFLKKKEAVYSALKGQLIMTFIAKPEHWVATGYNPGSTKGAVYTKLTPTSYRLL